MSDDQKPKGIWIPAWALGVTFALAIYGLNGFRQYNNLENNVTQLQKDLIALEKVYSETKSIQWGRIAELQKQVSKDKISVIKNDLEHVQADVADLKNYHKTYRTKSVP